MQHNHDDVKACPHCGLAPRLPRNALVLPGFEFLTKYLAPCACGAGPCQIEGGDPKTFRVYCADSCGITTKECESFPESVLAWNLLQESKGFDLRRLHPLNH